MKPSTNIRIWIDKKQDRCGDKKQSESIMKSPFEPNALQIIKPASVNSTNNNKKPIYFGVYTS